jgi:hypothetical protein
VERTIINYAGSTVIEVASDTPDELHLWVWNDAKKDDGVNVVIRRDGMIYCDVIGGC